MSEPRQSAAGRERLFWALLAVLAVSAVPRILGLRTELWMDEILSLRLVDAIRSPLGVFHAIQHDNNHYLNSLWIYAVGPGASSWLLRLPPILLGSALVGLAAVAAARQGMRASLVAAALVGASYPMIHYSSEARGYAYVLLFALVSYLALRRWLTDGRARWAIAYSASATLGFLAHLGFATIFMALLAWALFEAVSAPADRTRRVVRQLSAAAPPVVIVGLLWLVDLRFLEVAGGPPVGTLTSWLNAAGLLAGSAPGWLALPITAVAVACILLELRRMFAERESEALFFTFALLLPMANAIVAPHAYRRYYLTALLFALILLARFIDRTLAETGRGRHVAVLVLVSVVAVNVYQTVRFLDTGRGSHREAIAAMAAGTVDRPITVAGNHDMGHILTLDYHAKRLPGRPSFAYFCSVAMTRGCERPRPSREAGEPPPEYFVLAGSEDAFQPPARLDVRDVAVYELDDIYPKYGLSGVNWAVYRTID